ncbi:uncharacterized protein LOC143589645 [Bidens hawaiensis]|uniref:uncharacterized protein LOC143589645 n=1 Tax=Bidens hawaiensis TaxID=980011 RepID=UPI00404AB46C
MDIFARQPADMTGIPRSIAKHKLRVNPMFTPIAQKKRKMGPEQTKAMNEQVQDLLHAEIIREIKYQRLMDQVFKNQIGQNIEVYMDDLVIKSIEEDQMLRDIKETFETLRSINMKLNPAKCSFGMEEGKFLGVIIMGAVSKLTRIRSRPAIKGQVLEDFITEVPHHEEKDCLIEQQLQATPEQGQIWSLFTDGASSSEGFGMGLRLVNPEGHEFTYAIKLDFKSTNNEEKYEAFLVGLRISRKLRLKHLEARLNSMLIARQINGNYEAKNDVMASYLSQAKNLVRPFSSFNVVHMKRSENKSADALSKLASTNFEHFAKDIRVEFLDHPSVPQNQVLVIQSGTESWMTPIVAYLLSGFLPTEKAEAWKIKHKALNYQLSDGVLYQKSFLEPLLRCVDAEDANYLIREIHEGICGLHAGPRMTVAKLMNAEYYWPGMHLDAVQEIRKCDSTNVMLPIPCTQKMN